MYYNQEKAKTRLKLYFSVLIIDNELKFDVKKLC